MKIKNLIIALSLLMPLSTLSMERELETQPEARFCRYENGQWLFCGRNQQWWHENHPGIWERYGVKTRWNEGDSFVDVSEQSWISGFERSVYNSPK